MCDLTELLRGRGVHLLDPDKPSGELRDAQFSLEGIAWSRSLWRGPPSSHRGPFTCCFLHFQAVPYRVFRLLRSLGKRAILLIDALQAARRFH